MAEHLLGKLAAILQRALAGNDLTPEDGIVLLQQQKPEAIAAIRRTADVLRYQQVGDNVTYVINRNVNFTNICEQHCSFCAFRRDAGAEDAYWLELPQILEKVTDAVRRGATEICMQGGLNPYAKRGSSSLQYYVGLVEAIVSEFPFLHLHAFSPQEVQFIAREDGLSYAATIAALKAAGVGSLPGTAAEILDDAVRRILCPEKIDTATWLEIVGTAHRSGVSTTSTMLCGHIETAAQQISHLEHLRSLQQAAVRGNFPARISEFIALPYVGEQAPAPLRKRVGRDQPVLADALLLTAVARIYLGNWIPNHQPSWVKLGLDGAAEALTWGCNDLGGTLMEEHITSMAGARGGTCMTAEALRQAIAQTQRPYRQRDTLYRLLDNDRSDEHSVAAGAVS
ncbi:radical SAM domain protein, CofH subfamily [Rubidibacter lacunae KORDI 51-2]|uniref:5-amino-6-(D-ribitylamino)uracil--L-tyrosine 4-hydroxyphenyl transferase n=1 Tax=Rubidibacter lacunae KORDI 51-2 TaxID=582515 RepID=U5DNA1_9CHRO|nr:7,8-didemethyl-8-hydroxy-5-deazariboflavin synthase subunit CofH [Rubidibacter lacunae]ERN41170.1 radical SAM domain protein, CofH subfamily [Rubidibacter lacunae KORDI 51-2]